MYEIGEAVLHGHPDKVADQVADAFVDMLLSTDPEATLACDVMIKGREMLIAGEVGATDTIIENMEAMAHETARRVKAVRIYEERYGEFYVRPLFTKQKHTMRKQAMNILAGDQVLIRGYATYSTHNKLPMAHDLALGAARHMNITLPSIFGPDGKVLVILRDEKAGKVLDTLSVSVSLTSERYKTALVDYVHSELVPAVFSKAIMQRNTRIVVNPPDGIFIEGGTYYDTGLTGRKIAMDTYGVLTTSGGGAFSGKDPTKVDRTLAYSARYVARLLLQALGLRWIMVEVATQMGEKYPLAISATGNRPIEINLTPYLSFFNLDVAINMFGLRSDFIGSYQDTAVAGHFGNTEFPWEIL